MKWGIKMNLKMELSPTNQNLLGELGINVEDREYSQEEIKHFENDIFTHIMSKSSKNGDISREMNKYDELAKFLLKYSK